MSDESPSVSPTWNVNEFSELSVLLQRAVIHARSLCTHGASLKNDLLKEFVEGLNRELLAINGVPSRVAPYIKRLEEIVVDQAAEGVAIGERRYLTWHEAAVSVAQGLYFGILNAADPLQWSRVLCREIAGFDLDAVWENMGRVRAWLASQPPTDWETIHIGLRRESILFKQATTPTEAKPLERSSGEGMKKQRGRKPETDPKEDKRISDAWKTGSYATEADLARELNLSQREVHLAKDRDRKRQPKRRKESHP